MLEKTVVWAEQSAEYKLAYAEAIMSASSLGDALASRISLPVPVIFSEEYKRSAHRLMIAGQETFGVYSPVTSADPASAFEEQAAGVRHFCHAHGLKTPFWSGFREACGHFGLSPFGAAWTNVVKVQALNEHSASFRSLARDERALVLDWQKPLFRAELKACQPKMILALTGPNYDEVWDEMIDDLAWEPVGNHPRNWLLRGYSAAYDLKLVRTYHPGYLQRNADRWHLIQDAATCLQS